MRTIASMLACLCVCSIGLSAPPTVDFPKKTVATSDYVTIVPKTNAKTITYVKGYHYKDALLFEGVEPFPAAMLKDPITFMLPVRGLISGRYTYTGVASLNDEHTLFTFEILVEARDIPVPPVPPIPPNPPIPPTPVPPEVVYDAPIKLYVVEETAKRTTAVTKMLLDLDFWNELEKNGYIMRPYDVTSADAKKMGLDKIKDEKGNLRVTPFVVVVAKDGTVIGSYPFPLTREGVKAILPKVKVAAIKIVESDIAVAPVQVGVPSIPFPQSPLYHPTTGHTIPGTTVPHVVGQSPQYSAPIGTVHTPTNARMMVQSGTTNYCPT